VSDLRYGNADSIGQRSRWVRGREGIFLVDKLHTLKGLATMKGRRRRRTPERAQRD